MDPVRQAYKRRMELIDRVREVWDSGGLTSDALEKFAPESRLIESEIRLVKLAARNLTLLSIAVRLAAKISASVSIRRTVEPCSSLRTNSSETKVS